jgi:histone chaperone ASF1
VLCDRRLTDLSQAAAPLPSRIPSTELIGVTVILLTCSYAEQEFVRIGYYVNTEYGDPALKAQYDASQADGAAEQGIVPPDPTKFMDALVRNVLSEKPRVTRFTIAWCVPPLARRVLAHVPYVQG